MLLSLNHVCCTMSSNLTPVSHSLLFLPLSLCFPLLSFVYGDPGKLVGKSAGLVIGRLQVQIMAGVVGEFSSPELTLCVDSYSVSVPPQCSGSGM